MISLKELEYSDYYMLVNIKFKVIGYKNGNLLIFLFTLIFLVKQVGNAAP